MAQSRHDSPNESRYGRTWIPLWGVLNPLLLRFGAIILRGHIERHLPEPLTSPTQLRRWDAAVSALLRHGQLKTDTAG